MMLTTAIAVLTHISRQAVNKENLFFIVIVVNCQLFIVCYLLLNHVSETAMQPLERHIEDWDDED